jgi:hypothetical protein
VSYSRRELSISYDYVALANVVSVPEVAEHLEVLKRIRDCTAYGIQYPNGPVAHPPKQPNWSVIALATMYSIVMLGAAFLVYHYRPVYTGLPPVNAPYVGLNGWLAVVLRIMIQHAPTYSLASWNLLTTPGAKAYKPAYAPVLLFELLANLTFFIFSLLLLVLFFQKRYAFPNLFIIYLCVAVVLTLADHTAAFLWLGSTADTVQSVASERALFGSIWALAIWSSYIKKSQRVKATFVN